MQPTMDVSGGMFVNAGIDTTKLNRFAGAFPDPYLDYASTQMPRSIYDVLRWSEFVHLTYGTYRMAMQRVVRYFITSIELTDCSDDEKEKFEKFLYRDLDILAVLALAGDNFCAYGNDFLSVHVPFRRFLRCPLCHLEQPIRQVNYSWSDWKFTGVCKKCGKKVGFERVDRNSFGQDQLKIVHWSPHEMRLLYHPIMDKTVYLWEIPSWFKGEIRRGNPFYVETTEWEVIEAIRENVLFKFADDHIFHMREESIAGVRCFGWGIPRIMGNFKQAWYIQVLKRFNEAIALDYIMPMRVITPVPGTSKEADPLLHMNLSQFQARVLSMLRHHRKDPASVHMLPFPVQMDMLGADGSKLAPIELIDKATDEFLNAQGVVAELYRGTLQWQAMPVALRLFERTWIHMVNAFNRLLNWIFDKVSRLNNWENLRGRLQPVTLADDLEKKQIQLQLAAGQQISRQTAWAPFNINFRDEIKRMLQEEEYSQEEMAKFQEQQQQKQQLQGTMMQGAIGQPQQQPGQPGQPQQAPAGQPAAGQPQPGQSQPGMPGAGGEANYAPDPHMTPEDLLAKAENISYQLLGTPYETRRSELLKIKRANSTLHALVISKMKELRQSAQQQGGQQVLAQTVGAQAAQ